MDLVGVILCGGAGSRIGGRKAFVELAGASLVARVADTLKPGLRALAVAGDVEAARAVGAVALDDPPGLERGPLAGICAGLEWGLALGAEWVMVAPCDAPLLPPGLAKQLSAGAGAADVACVETEDGLHPLMSLWRSRLAPWLREEMRSGHPPVHRVLDKAGAVGVLFADAGAFLNINTPADLMLAERRLRDGS
jgi:molybdopterin-guanine dinucleotide biosynthesis protein A